MNKDLTIGNPEKVLWNFCLPLFGSIIFQQLYNIADSWVAGRYIGENALASVGNSYEITLILIAFAFGCSSKNIYHAYEVWCDDNSLKPLSSKTFVSILKDSAKEYGLIYSNNIPNTTGKLVRGFQNINVLVRPIGEY